MRLVKVSAPEGKSAEIIKLAFSLGIEKVKTQTVDEHQNNGTSRKVGVVDIETSTPQAKKFVTALLKSGFYNQTEFTISTRQPRSIIARANLRELTKPLAVPPTDLLEELWQFSQITPSFIGRYSIAGGLLAFGLIQQQILIIIAGLLFLPVLPLLLSISFGFYTRQWNLVRQAATAFSTAVVLLTFSGAFVALFSAPPVKYTEFNSSVVSLIISLAVGIAAALASIDDTGKRELIGLAATSQVAIIPVWFGVCFIIGFPATISTKEISHQGMMFFVNFTTILASSAATYFCFERIERNSTN